MARITSFSVSTAAVAALDQLAARVQSAMPGFSQCRQHILRSAVIVTCILPPTTRDTTLRRATTADPVTRLPVALDPVAHHALRTLTPCWFASQSMMLEYALLHNADSIYTYIAGILPPQQAEVRAEVLRTPILPRPPSTPT